MSGRRNLLAGAAALAGASLPAHATPQAMGDSDRRLLELHREAQAEYERDILEGRLADTANGFGDRIAGAVHEAARDAAWDGYVAALEAMAETPAAGLLGIALKAAVVCRGLDVGVADVERAVAESLAADLARLVPEVAA